MSVINFIDKLTEETMGLRLADLPTEASSVVKFLKDKSLLYYVLTSEPSIATYRMLIKKTIIDFPINWGEFSSLSSDQVLFKIQDHILIDILSKNFFNRNLVKSFLLLKKRDIVYFIVCSENEEQLMRELNNRFFRQEKILEAA